MPKFIVLAGVSGVGKSYRRTTDPALKDLPYVDIADIYRDNPGILPRQAFSMMVTEAFAMINDGKETIVLEALFKKNGFQREGLEYYADAADIQIEYIDLTASVEECVQRIKAQEKKAIAEGEDKQWWNTYTKARLEYLR